MIEQALDGCCPYCGSYFDKKPQRKTKCRQCHNFVYVRTDPDTCKKVLVTKDRADQIQEIYNQKATSSAFRNKVLSFIQVSIADYEISKKILHAKFRSVPSDTDILWHLANQKLLISNDHHDKHMIYYAMALIDHARGRDPYRHLKLSIQQNIYEHRSKGATHLQIMSDHCCDECKILNGKIISVEDALSEMPLPFKGCKNPSGLCQCEYLHHVDINDLRLKLNKHNNSAKINFIIQSVLIIIIVYYVFRILIKF